MVLIVYKYVGSKSYSTNDPSHDYPKLCLVPSANEVRSSIFMLLEADRIGLYFYLIIYIPLSSAGDFFVI
jgi:hypothetical protein